MHHLYSQWVDRADESWDLKNKLSDNLYLLQSVITIAKLILLTNTQQLHQYYLKKEQLKSKCDMG